MNGSVDRLRAERTDEDHGSAEPTTEAAGDDAAIVPLQPYPEETWVVYHQIDGRILTGIYRRWRPGDATRCRLCDACAAAEDCCLMIFRSYIPRTMAPLACAVGLPPNRTDHPPASLADCGLWMAD